MPLFCTLTGTPSLFFNRHTEPDYAIYMSRAGTWASDLEAQAAAEILGHPGFLFGPCHTGRHGFLLIIRTPLNLNKRFI